MNESPTTEQGRAELARVNAKIESLAFRINMRIQNEPRTMGWLLSFFSGANRDYVQEAVWRLVNSGKAKFGEDLRLTACGNNRPEDEK